MNHRFEVTEKFLELCATGSLIGTFATEKVDWRDCESITLVFPQTTYAWRKENGGPKHYIIPEYTIPCLLKDVLHIQKMGIKVIIEEVLR